MDIRTKSDCFPHNIKSLNLSAFEKLGKAAIRLVIYLRAKGTSRLPIEGFS